MTYTGGTRQFEGSFRITSMGGSRISLKQTFRDAPSAGPYFMLAVERGGRLYAIHGGDTLGSGATVGTSVRVNTVHQVGSTHKVYINGSLKQTVSSSGGSYYDKFGAYRTASGAGPVKVTWSGIKFWRKCHGRARQASRSVQARRVEGLSKRRRSRVNGSVNSRTFAKSCKGSVKSSSGVSVRSG